MFKVPRTHPDFRHSWIGRDQRRYGTVESATTLIYRSSLQSLTYHPRGLESLFSVLAQF